jgi:uncharacterized OsmC-like protein
MTGLNAFLKQKREAIMARRKAVEDGSRTNLPIAARVSAEGRSGIRRIRIRDFQVVSDSPSDFAGYDLGPSSPELQLGVLGSCITHSFLIQAAIQDVSIESLSVEIEGTMDARATHPANVSIPVHPHDLSYVVHIVSSAPSEEIEALHLAVEQTCPILNLLRKPQKIKASICHRPPVGPTGEQSA